MDCLQIADQQLHVQSVAFPALGTGVLKYPPDVVAKLLVDATAEYVSSNRTTGLREIKLVVFQLDGKTQQVINFLCFYDNIFLHACSND